MIKPIKTSNRTTKQIISDVEKTFGATLFVPSSIVLIHHSDCGCPNCFEINLQNKLDAILNKFDIV